MRVKGVSLSAFRVNVDIYNYEKLSLFAFLFTRIILDESLDKDLKIVDCLTSLEIKDDLLYLFNNVYYEFVDNKIIEEISEDIYSLTIKDIKINKRFIESLKNGYMPVLVSSVNKEFIYDYLKKKIVISEEVYDDSNLVLIKVDNSLKNIEDIINENKESLFDIKNGECIVKDILVDPYYFEINLKEDNDYFYSDYNIYDDLENNSFYLNKEIIKGNILTNNIYFKCLFGNEELKDYSDYVFVFNKDKEFVVKDNIIYVGFEFNEGDFIDLINKEAYRCGVYKLKNDSKVSTYVTSKSNIVSDFKLYLSRNKDKFTSNIKSVIDLF